MTNRFLFSLLQESPVTADRTSPANANLDKDVKLSWFSLGDFAAREAELMKSPWEEDRFEGENHAELLNSWVKSLQFYVLTSLVQGFVVWSADLGYLISSEFSSEFECKKRNKQVTP